MIFIILDFLLFIITQILTIKLLIDKPLIALAETKDQTSNTYS